MAEIGLTKARSTIQNNSFCCAISSVFLTAPPARSATRRFQPASPSVAASSP